MAAPMVPAEKNNHIKLAPSGASNKAKRWTFTWCQSMKTISHNSTSRIMIAQMFVIFGKLTHSFYHFLNFCNIFGYSFHRFGVGFFTYVFISEFMGKSACSSYPFFVTRCCFTILLMFLLILHHMFQCWFCWFCFAGIILLQVLMIALHSYHFYLFPYSGFFLPFITRIVLGLCLVFSFVPCSSLNEVFVFFFVASLYFFS